MISDEKIEVNKITFIDLLKSITRENARIDDLIKYLESSDFFESPFTTSYSYSYKGGLCEQALNTFYILTKLVDNSDIEVYDNDSIIILSLLHNVGKIGTFKLTSRNVKEYCDFGRNSDDLGRFNWKSITAYTYKDDDELFIYGNCEETSEKMISTFIPLTYEESSSILNCKGGMAADSVKLGTPRVFNRYPMAVLLHCADLMSTYIRKTNE